MKPTPKQLSYLRALALCTGQTFTMPTTTAQASAEIRRLRRARRSDAGERAQERRELVAERERQQRSCAVQPHELGGFGAGAHWTPGR